MHCVLRSQAGLADWLLVAGIEPAPTVFRHGRSRLKLYQLSYTNKEASYSQVTGGVVGPDKLSARNWLAFWRSVSWIIRRMNLRTKPRKGTGESYQNPPTSQAEFQLRGLLNQRQNAVRPLHLLDHRAVAVALAGIHHLKEWTHGHAKTDAISRLGSSGISTALWSLRPMEGIAGRRASGQSLSHP